MPSRFSSNAASSAHGSRPAPIPSMDVYSVDGGRCYTVPKVSISHRGQMQDNSHNMGAPTGKTTDASATTSNGPTLCTAYCDYIAKKDPTSTGCPLGSRCPNVHIDVPLSTLKSEEVHSHYLWSDESNVTYERLIQPMMRDRPKTVSPKDIANVMLEVYGPNNREPFEMIPAGKVLHTRGARYAFDTAVGTPNRTPSTSRPCHCAHYYFNQVCNRGAGCAFIHVVSVDPAQREPCIKAANYHRRIAILAGDHHHSPSTQQHQPPQNGGNTGSGGNHGRSPGASMHNVTLMGHPNPNNSPNILNYGNTQQHSAIPIQALQQPSPSHHRDPQRENSFSHGHTNSGLGLGSSGLGGISANTNGSFFTATNSPAAQMASDQSILNTRNSPAVSRYSTVLPFGGDGGSAASTMNGSNPQMLRTSPSAHLLGSGPTVNNSPAPSINHQTATPHHSPYSPDSNSNATPTQVSSGMSPPPPSPGLAGTQRAAPSSPPPPPQQALLPRSPSTSANVITTKMEAVSPSTPTPQQQAASATPPPPPTSSLSPIRRPHLNTNAIGSSLNATRQQSEVMAPSPQQSHNAMTLPADDLQDGGEYQQQQHYTMLNTGGYDPAQCSNNNITIGGGNSASNRFSPRNPLNAHGGVSASFGSPYGSRQISSALPADDVSPYSLNNTVNSSAAPNPMTLSPRTSAAFLSGPQSVVVGDAAAAAARAKSPTTTGQHSRQRTNSCTFSVEVGGVTPVVTVGGQVQRNLLANGFPLPATDSHQRQASEASFLGGQVKRTDSYYSEAGDHFGAPSPYGSANNRTPPPQPHHAQGGGSAPPCGNSMFSPEGGMVGVGMGGEKCPMTPQSQCHSAQRNSGGTMNNNSFCNSPSCAAHLTNSNLVTPKSARVPTGRFTHQPYTPPTTMYVGTPVSSMHVGAI